MRGSMVLQAAMPSNLLWQKTSSTRQRLQNYTVKQTASVFKA